MGRIVLSQAKDINHGRIVLSQAKDINHGKDCSITSERYKSWEGLFYHKRKI